MHEIINTNLVSTMWVHVNSLKKKMKTEREFAYHNKHSHYLT